jgi:hypothetical protein
MVTITAAFIQPMDAVLLPPGARLGANPPHHAALSLQYPENPFHSIIPLADTCVMVFIIITLNNAIMNTNVRKYLEVSCRDDNDDAMNDKNDECVIDGWMDVGCWKSPFR